MAGLPLKTARQGRFFDRRRVRGQGREEKGGEALLTSPRAGKSKARGESALKGQNTASARAFHWKPRPCFVRNNGIAPDGTVNLAAADRRKARSAERGRAIRARSHRRHHRLPHPLELVAGSPIDRAELFGAALEVGQGDGSWARCRGTEPAGNGGAVASTGPWPAEAYADDLITKRRTGGVVS